MEEYRHTRFGPRLVAVAVQVRVQEVIGEGEFGAELDLATAARQQVGTDGQPIRAPKLPPYTGQNADEIEQVVTQLEESLVQGLILRPDYWPIMHAATQKPVDWRNNLPKVLWPEAKEPLSQQFEQGRILVWFHHDGLAGRKSYRYKAQLVMLNPLLTHDKLVDPKKPQDARIATLATPWSPWSEPVRVPRTTSFLLTGSNSLSRPPYVTVTVFARALGRQVSRSFKVSPGQAIGGPDKQADFSTGAIVVDLDFDRYIYSGPVRRKTTQMLYLDDKGLLRSRIYAIDRVKFDARNRLAKPAAGAPEAAAPAPAREEMFEDTKIRRKPPPEGRGIGEPVGSYPTCRRNGQDPLGA